MDTLLELKVTAINAIDECISLKDLQDLRVLYLGKKGPIQEAMKSMKDMDQEARVAFGQVSNSVKAEITEA